MFAVDGEQVSRARRRRDAAAARRRQPRPQQAAELPRPSAGVRVVETATRPAPDAPAQPMPPQQTERGSAPPPARGLSIRGQPAGAMAPRGGDEPAAPSQPPPAAAPALPLRAVRSAEPRT